ncbi:ATP-binding protein [Methylobacterium sp. E-041]|uniref:AlbA family DNA-binding domain-containing protein n=1 Tax=unclassified Methylobacterium TaxID=2615210 RepID=UPI0011C7B6E0|nr:MULTISPECIES: ATP-binding protein [unclassified Methylobacterium]MCJ2105229.1 ATP-binding protein [Methylobacterium sp. E-041]TXM93097.1 ATP-binding protein [Methylobacterium sp. WL116]
MLPQAIDALTFSDVEAMVEAGLREGRTLDFKQALVGGKDDDKREFLADVSALANTAGGDIVFGITEAQGEATGAPGIELADPDAEVLRLEGSLRSGLEPRLPRVEVRWLAGPSGKGLLLVRIPRSYLGPHRVTFRNHGHFYGRTNAGKTALDVTELRAAFLSAEGVHDRIRRFRNERLSIIEAGEGPVGLRSGAKAVLHVVPLETFAAKRDVGIDRNHDLIFPFGLAGGSFNARHTLEGFATFSGQEQDPDGTYGYAMLFRSGIIEGAATVGHKGEDGWFIPASTVEWSALQALQSYREKLTKKGVELPLYVFLSLIGVRGHNLSSSGRAFDLKRPTRTDVLLLPEAVITDPQQTDEEVLRPVFDRLWNAFGFDRSFSFNAAGKYTGERY